MIVIAIRTLILYIVVLTTMRLMGKREIGQLQPYELVITILVADLAAIPMQDINVPLVDGLVPIAILLVMHLLLSIISLKFRGARNLISGTPSILIESGRLMESELRKSRYNISDLLEQLRQEGIFSIGDVRYAIMETNGSISILSMDDKDESLAITVIMDGKLIKDGLYEAGYNEEWLYSTLKSNGILDEKNVFFAYIDARGRLRYQLQDRRRVGLWY